MGITCPSTVQLTTVQYSIKNTFTTATTGVNYESAALGQISSSVYYAGTINVWDLVIYKEKSDGTQEWARVYSPHAIYRKSFVVANDEQYLYAMKNTAAVDILKINASTGALVKRYYHNVYTTTGNECVMLISSDDSTLYFTARLGTSSGVI